MASSIMDLFSGYGQASRSKDHVHGGGGNGPVPRLGLSQTSDNISRMTLSSAYSTNVDPDCIDSSTTSSIPLHPSAARTKNILIANSGGARNNALNKTMARSVEIEHLKNNRQNRNNNNGSSIKLARPISLVNNHASDDYPSQRSQFQSEFDRVFHDKLVNGRIKVRLLVFVEDADGSRSNIFDSAKHASINNNNSSNNALNLGSREIRRLSKSVMTNNHNNRADSAGSLPNNNNNSNSANSNASSANGSQTSTASTSATKLNNEMITRMVFGSFPMLVSNRTAIKVHSLK
jgi:hypothetical protein